MNKQQLTTLFKKEITDNLDKIDPEQTHDWYSLTLGWALAKGLSPEKALDFATYIRYNTNLG